jgi:hypothetical protein
MSRDEMADAAAQLTGMTRMELEQAVQVILENEGG